jgi:hypothetical protein
LRIELVLQTRHWTNPTRHPTLGCPTASWQYSAV